jgi:hypothetical protein
MSKFRIVVTSEDESRQIGFVVTSDEVQQAGSIPWLGKMVRACIEHQIISAARTEACDVPDEKGVHQ